MPHVRQSRPESGLGLLVKALNSFEVVASLLVSGCCREVDLLVMKSTSAKRWGRLWPRCPREVGGLGRVRRGAASLDPVWPWRGQLAWRGSFRVYG